MFELIISMKSVPMAERQNAKVRVLGICGSDMALDTHRYFLSGLSDMPTR